MENGLDFIKQFNSLSDAEKNVIMQGQAEQRRLSKNEIENLTNVEIASRDDFKEFCSERGIEPSKRQVSKSKQEFFDWKKQQNETL